jgi:hypothetical protein
MSVTTETQIVREAPELEAIKMNLLSEAAKLAYRPEFGGQLPNIPGCRLFSCSRGGRSSRHATGRWKFSALH